MYFNNKKNSTNIDHEFNDNNDNILSCIVNFVSKYKMIFIISIVVIVLLIAMLLIFINKKSNNYLILTGDEEITIYQGDSYIEPGYKAYTSRDEDLTSEVKLESNLNTGVIGEYEIVYKLGDIFKVRYVKVIAKPKDYVFMSLTPVNNKVDIYLRKGDKYIEPGYSAFNTSGEDLTSKVTIDGKVDTSKKGTYTLTYSVVDVNGVKISKVRKVVVMDSELSLTLNNSNYTNQDVIINAYVIDEYFDYMILPNNEKVTVNNYSYKVSNNGTYIFKAYDKKGNSKESSIKVNNIDKEAPSGSCGGSYKDGVSLINVNARDNIGIANYVVNGKSYTSKNITINSELKIVNVTINDKAGNSKNISCNLEDNSSPIISDKSITFSYSYVADENYMPYALYTPSIDNKGKDIPLVVWLHGGGEFNSSQNVFKNSGLLKVLNNWKLDGFNAYVMCPHVSGKWFLGYWVDDKVVNNLYSLIDKFIKENNVNTNKVILVGHSQGARGVIYAPTKRLDFFSSLVILSGFDPVNDISALKHIPAKGYSEGFTYMRTSFVNTFGKENYMDLNTSHGNIPNMAFNLDENNDNKSDLVEWMLMQELKK